MLTALQDGVLVVTLNDPARRNPVSTLMREQLIAALAAAAADDAVRVVVLTGATARSAQAEAFPRCRLRRRKTAMNG
jgi:enoyl-CoA hydratase/carnithine racemase